MYTTELINFNEVLKSHFTQCKIVRQKSSNPADSRKVDCFFFITIIKIYQVQLNDHDQLFNNDS